MSCLTCLVLLPFLQALSPHPHKSFVVAYVCAEGTFQIVIHSSVFVTLVAKVCMCVPKYTIGLASPFWRDLHYSSDNLPYFVMENEILLHLMHLLLWVLQFGPG